jgi:glycosyltransferase involved in cell wall biosynthesis
VGLTLRIAFLRSDDLSGLAEAPEGGSFTHAGGLARGLMRLGHEVYFVASGPASDIRDGSAPLHVVPFGRFFQGLPDVPHVAYNFKLVAVALPILARRRPSVIYQRHSAFNCAGVVLSRLLGVPLVLEVNNSEVWLQSHWGRLVLTGLCRLFEDVAFRGADALFVVSDVLKRDLVRSGVAADRIVVNPNGVDAQAFHPGVDGSVVRREHGLDGKVVAGFLGTFGVWHGVPVLADAFVAAARRDARLHLLAIGDGPLAAELVRRVREAGVASRVTMAGLVPHERVAEHLAACDLLVSPHVPCADGSEFFGSPTKLFEYMAMGRGIVASALGQIREALADGTSALLVRPGHAGELAGAMLRLAGDPALGARLGAEARRIAVESYTWEANARRVVEARERLAAPRRRAAAGGGGRHGEGEVGSFTSIGRPA